MLSLQMDGSRFFLPLWDLTLLLKADGASEKSVSSDFGLNINTLGNRFTIGFYYTL
ncbi:MAG: hypothetical protein IPM04_08960 [Saprospiraceae bacterium]|nr:hypothetical protein [Candidatus Brachybacter algidus]MBK8747987.1 hypothetical protein [Candidatus Brachybacter algidus]